MLNDINIINIEENKDQSQDFTHFYYRIKSFNEFMDYVYSKPKEIVEKGFDSIYNFITNNPFTCGCCLCSTITATVSIASLAIGLGIGLGVGCSQIDNAFLNSTNT